MPEARTKTSECRQSVDWSSVEGVNRCNSEVHCCKDQLSAAQELKGRRGGGELITLLTFFFLPEGLIK